MRRLVGVDGCRGGWLAASAGAGPHCDLDGFRLYASFADLLADFDGREAVLAVDMPIGLAACQPRACDRAARVLLRPPRASSVFPAPCRAALAGVDDADICRLNQEASGKSLSRQCVNIVRKIREVDQVLTPQRQSWIREAHPEVTFAVLCGGGRGLLSSKKTPAGVAERLALLDLLAAGLDLKAERARLGPAAVAGDDLVDALACLATAYRLLQDRHRTFPDGPPEIDERGLRMEIVA